MTDPTREAERLEAIRERAANAEKWIADNPTGGLTWAEEDRATLLRMLEEARSGKYVEDRLRQLGQWRDSYAHKALQYEASQKALEAERATSRALRVALVKAAIPLEVLNADNYMGAKWMTDELRQSVATAVLRIRAALQESEPT